MLKSKTTDRVCCVAMAVMIAVSLVLWGLVEPVRGDGSHTVGYEDLLFDQGRVHTIEITMDGWDEMIANAAAEEYTDCNIVVDGEKYNHVAIRPKGNTSLSSVSSLSSTRYSFKVEFDHFVEGMTYHGLDKLSLNNLIQDATMMKDYLAYTLMNRMGVPSSLCSYVQIIVNGEAWGLYLAVEGVEDGFMDRNGLTKGELYKPDRLSFGGGRGNGGGFDIEKFRVNDDEESGESEDSSTQPDSAGVGGFGGFGDFSGMPSGMPDGMPGNLPEGMSGGMPQMPEGFSFGGDGSQMPTSEGEEASDGSGESTRERRGFSGRSEGGGFGGFGASTSAWAART